MRGVTGTAIIIAHTTVTIGMTGTGTGALGGVVRAQETGQEVPEDLIQRKKIEGEDETRHPGGDTVPGQAIGTAAEIGGTAVGPVVSLETAGPRMIPGLHLPRAEQGTLRGNATDQRGETMMILTRTEVGITVAGIETMITGDPDEAEITTETAGPGRTKGRKLTRIKPSKSVLASLQLCKTPRMI